MKAHTRIIVCMGNPPYDREQIDPDDPATERRGGWVRHGDDYHDPLLTSFLEPARAAGHGIHLKNFYLLLKRMLDSHLQLAVPLETYFIPKAIKRRSAARWTLPSPRTEPPP